MDKRPAPSFTITDSQSLVDGEVTHEWRAIEPKLGDIGKVRETGETVIWNGECWIGKGAQRVGE